MADTSSARSRQREQTRRRIEQEALRQFRARGFHDVTVSDICDEAGVGPATFYRHFPTKEEVVFAYWDDFVRALRTAVVTTPSDLPRHEQLPRILVSFARYLESQRELLALRDEIVLGDPALLRRTVAMQRETEAELAAGLTRLRHLDEPDAAVQLEAALGMVVLRTAVRCWRAGQRPSLPSAVHHALVDARRALDALVPDGPGQQAPEAAD
jgi:AcrR family transcriptional regulator